LSPTSATIGGLAEVPHRRGYGTFRSAVVGNLLQQRYNVHLNGIDLISSVLDLSTITFADGDDRVYTYYLPSYAAVAWYFKALKDRPAALEPFLDEVRQYAAGPYAAALFRGAALPAAEKAAVAKRVVAYTGLSEEYLIRANLRVKLAQFNAELLRSAG
jgi:carboxypeptidase C (cathepsin A)